MLHSVSEVSLVIDIASFSFSFRKMADPLKVVLVGSSAVGKTSFFTMFETKTFPGFHLSSSLGID